jgi:hypothetical protein
MYGDLVVSGVAGSRVNDVARQLGDEPVERANLAGGLVDNLANTAESLPRRGSVLPVLHNWARLVPFVRTPWQVRRRTTRQARHRPPTRSRGLSRQPTNLRSSYHTAIVEGAGGLRWSVRHDGVLVCSGGWCVAWCGVVVGGAGGDLAGARGGLFGSGDRGGDRSSLLGDQPGDRPARAPGWLSGGGRRESGGGRCALTPGTAGSSWTRCCARRWTMG